MNNPSPNPNPFVPQFPMLEQKNRQRARVRIFVFVVLSVNVIGLMAMLMSGCRKPAEQTEPAVDTNMPAPALDTNLPPIETNTAMINTNFVPPPIDMATPAIASAQEYTVERGDNFYSIAKKFNVTMKSVQEANPGVEPTKLRVGQKIHIPAPTAAAAPSSAPTAAPAAANGQQTYTVKSGDTLTKIATDHGTTVKALRAANNLTTDRITVGQKLKIPVKESAPAPVTVPAPAPAPAAVTPAPAPATPQR